MWRVYQHIIMCNTSVYKGVVQCCAVLYSVHLHCVLWRTVHLSGAPCAVRTMYTLVYILYLCIGCIWVTRQCTVSVMMQFVH